MLSICVVLFRLCLCCYVCDYKGRLCLNFDERVEKFSSFCEEIVIGKMTPGDGVRVSKT